MSTTIITADTLDRPAMRELFNAGFSGYLVPMHLDEGMFETHLACNDIDLAASPVLVDDGPVAFALVGIRGADAWIGGMGTVPAARRRGHARQVMQAALESARARGCRSVWLEVLEANQPALALYEQLGFETIRDLLVWALPRASAPAIAAIDLGTARSFIEAHRMSREPWQRADSVITTLENDGEDLLAIGVQRNGELEAAAIGAVADRSTTVLQIAAPDEGVAVALLGSAAAGGPLRLANVPADEPASQAMASLGGELVARQHEMCLTL